LKVCNSIFEKLEIDDEGEAYFCCEERVVRQSIGNVFKQDFSDVWNSELAIKIRKASLEGKYPYCNAKICHKLVNNKEEHFCEAQEHFKPIMEKYPIQISFPIDQDCNAKCIFCRDKLEIATEERLNDLREKLNNIYLPMCKDIEYLTVNNLGDAFFSKFSREFIKTVSEKYPNIKFVIMTNGICATKELFKELNLEGRIKEFDVSINAVKQSTHEKIFRTKGFKQLQKNIEYIGNLKKEGKIENLNFNFVICKYNWKEMKPFIKYGFKHNAQINFWEVRDYYNNTLDNKYEDMTVHTPTSKEYQKFKKYICSKEFEQENITLSPVIKKIRAEALKEKPLTFWNKLFN
jgi:MoaA/NifB/PqqE/SkfB family radical SAM enzyme